MESTCLGNKFLIMMSSDNCDGGFLTSNSVYCISHSFHKYNNKSVYRIYSESASILQNRKAKMEELQEKVTRYVSFLFKEYTNPNLVYHNLSHTLQVVKRTEEIERHYHLSSLEKFIITTAAWFHDIGHLFGEIKEHEQKSVDIMQAFLTANVCDRNIINQIAACILVTKFPSSPGGLTEQILCDADTYHLGTNEFPECDELVKKEMLLRKKMQTDDWDIHTLAFLQQHKYFTIYCRELLNPGKLENISILKARINKQQIKQ